jgi:hypothetical protein
MNHRIGQWIFGLGVGLLVAVLAYRWVTDSSPRAERQLEESVVAAARTQLETTLSLGRLDLVDPLAPDRKVGKAYVYRAGEGWEVSGYYRRDEDDSWHPFLMTLDTSPAMTHLRIKDQAFTDRAATDPAIEVLP